MKISTARKLDIKKRCVRRTDNFKLNRKFLVLFTVKHITEENQEIQEETQEYMERISSQTL